MKKRITVIFCLILVCCTATAYATTFFSLSQLQKYIFNHSPASMEEQRVKLEGTISEIVWCGANNHYDMTLLVEDPDASVPVGEDTPRLTVHFRLHVDPIPFAVGDKITVDGTLNGLYSSYMVPCIIADYINGSDNF